MTVIVLELLAVLVHGMAAACNVIGFFYNLLVARRVDRHVVAHAAAGFYHVTSVWGHAKRLQGCAEKE